MDMKTAENFTRLRKEHGYSQEELADRLGVSRQAVSKWERGESSPDTENLIALAVLYGESLDDMLLHYGARKKSEDIGAENSEEEDSEQKAAEEDGNAERKKEENPDDFIYVRSDEGEEVRLGKDGIHLDDGKGNRIEIAPFKINVHSSKCGEKKKTDFRAENRDCEDDDCSHHKHYGATVNVNGVHYCGRGKDGLKPWLEIMQGLVFLMTLGAFLAWGFLADDGWRYSWLAWFALPTVSSLITAISHKRPCEFAFPVLVVGVYLGLGMYFNLWHPMWALFFLIPVYYISADILKHVWLRWKMR